MKRAALLTLGCLALCLAAAVSGCGGGSNTSGNANAAARAGDAGSASGAGHGAEARGADLILVTLDTLRHDTLGFAGHPTVQTPVLDRLAASGRVFTNAHAHNVVTLPSHANILTGLYPYQHGIRDNTGYRLDASTPTLATRLKAAGYSTAAFVAAFPLDARFGLDRGFDVYDDRYPQGSNPSSFEIAERPGDEVIAAALNWWRGEAGKKRFLWVHLYDPHAPYVPPEPYRSRFADEPYLGEVAATDAYLGPLLEPFLDGGERPALVAVTSDHGEALGEHGELTHGLFAYEATLKVPLILWGPGIPAGKDDRQAGHVDLMPTLLGALAVEPPEGLPGTSLLAPAPDEDPLLYFEALSSYLNRGWAPLKGGLSAGKKWIELPIPELYDLSSDPEEKTNIFDEDRRSAALLNRRMPEQEEWPPGRGSLDSEEVARLRALGYFTGDTQNRTSFTAEDDPKRLVGLDRKMHEVIDLYSRGRLEDAAQLAREVVDERPTMAVGYQHLSLVLRQLERPREAIEALEAALARGVVSETLSRELGLTLAENGRAAEAVRVLEPLADENDPETLVALGNSYYAAGRLEQARDTLGRVLAADPEDVKALEGLGAVALSAGRPDIARGYLEKAVSINDELPISWNSLGVARYQTGDTAGAMAAWQRSVNLDPRQFDALFNFGRVAVEARQAEAAREAFRRFLATAPPERYAAELSRARQLLAQLP